ncbi:MAG: hypothetical protein IPJ55_09050 [Chloracidobacterium sp.]|nr:hypothetical protein [Chloracidobacterium sp.]
MADQRNTSLDNVLFDVKLRPLLVNAGKGDYGGTLFKNGGLTTVPKYRAVVDLDRENVLCVVSKDYALVSNERYRTWQRFWPSLRCGGRQGYGGLSR